MNRRAWSRGALAAALVGGTVTSGCFSAKEMSGVRARVQEMKQDVGALQMKLAADIDTGGGNFNEPVTGWIMAAGYATVPATLLFYLIAHRFRSFRWIKDRIRGRPKEQDSA